MKSFKKRGLAVGLAASLIVSSFVPAAFAAEKGLDQRVYPQLERFDSSKAKISQVSKEEGKKFIENQLVVKYKAPLSASDHRKAGGKLIKGFASLGYDVIEVQGNNKLEDVANNYAKLANVSSVTRSAYVTRMATPDPKVQDMFHLSNLNVEKAQSLAGTNKVKVAVIDTGIDASHPELKNKLITNVNVMNSLKKGLPDSHGTHVAGIIAAEKGNGIGGYGIAPNSDIVSIDVFNRSFFTSDYTIAEGILEAIRQDVDVMNMSLGSYYPSPIIKDAVQKAIDKGIVIVAAAGNDGVNLASYPASYEGVISVGATDENNELAFFSTYGPAVDVVAPGHKVYAPVYDVDKGSSFVEMSGTSMATPVVTGAVSLLLSKHPNLTPYQVSYILTKTAKDLGEKGYDLKYGYGMIDLEKILSFDPATIPADPAVKEEDAIAKAKDLDFTFEGTQVSGKIQKLNQTDLYRTSLKKDEYIQITLSGKEKYDLKFELLFFKNGESKVTKKIEVNNVAEGNVEGTLFQAPEDGTLVIAVKDSFGKYHEAGQSSYELALHKSEELLVDDNTMENPVVIGSLPFTSSWNNFITDELLTQEAVEVDGEDSAVDAAATSEVVKEEESSETKEVEIHGDSDFFRFTIPNNEEGEMQTVKISLSDIPGIDPSIKLHMVEKMDGEEFVYEMNQSSNFGIGKGEELVFSAMPGQEFIAEVTNKPYYYDIFYMYEDVEVDEDKAYSSFIPYQVKIDVTTLPEDEDNLPAMYGMDSPEEALIEGDIEEYLARKAAIKEIMVDSYTNWYEEYIKTIKESARELGEEEAGEGYLQTSGDEDWFIFTPKHSSIFEVNFAKTNGYKPAQVNIQKYDEESKGFYYLYSNSMWNWTDGSVSVEDSFTLGLQAGETYYFQISDVMYQPSFEPYSFSVKTLVKDTADKFEANDSYKDATKITTGSFTANFGVVNDEDYYYFKPGKEGVFSVNATPGELPAKYNNVPAKHKSEIDLVLVVIEDTNGNGKLDKEEESNMTYVDSTLFNEAESLGFKTKKDAGYFIVAFDYYGHNSSLVPYVLTVGEVNHIDEDQGSIVKNNIPSQPIFMTSTGKNSFYGTGYLNMTSNKGDVDYFKFYVSEAVKRTLTFKVPADIDGKVTVYDEKGTQIASSDLYGIGDNEVLSLDLKKGSYYIKVEDTFGNASAEPYEILIK